MVARAVSFHCFAVVGFALGLLVAARSAPAQQVPCHTINPPCPPDEPPSVWISPESGTYTTAALDVAVHFYDDYELDWSTARVNQAFTTMDRSRYSGSYSGTLQLQTGTTTVVTASICDGLGQCDTASASYIYAPPPPPPPHSAPILSLQAYNDDNRDASRCLASCFEQTLAYTTPAYVSLDVSRSITLVYSAAQVLPEATIFVDATDASNTPPAMMSLRLQQADQTFVPLEGVAGNPTEIFFAQGATGTSRLGARFNTGASSTGSYNYTAVVTSYFSDATLASTIPVRVLVKRETQSPYGYGWSIAGLQRVIWQPDGIVVIDGDGSIAFFANCPTGCGTYVSPKGDFTTLTSVGGVNGVYYRRTWPDGTTADFNWHGQMTAVSDRFGNGTSYAYTEFSQLGSLASITDPAGLVTTFGYDGNGKLDFIRDPAGRVTQVTVNAAGDLTEIFDPDGVRALQMGYDAAHLSLFAVDRVGGRSDFSRDFTGRLSQVQLAMITANGISVRPTVSFRAIERQVLLDGSGPGTAANPAARRLPDSLRAKITGPSGDSTLHAFDRFGQATRAEFRSPQGKWRVNTTSYNDQGQPTIVTTADEGGASYIWSGSDLTHVTDNATGKRTDLSYEFPYHQVQVVWVNSITVQQNFYGSLGQLDSTKVGTSKTSYTYDPRGRVLTITDPLGHRTSASYDATGMLNTHSVTAPDANGVSRTTSYAYDAAGRTQSVSDPTGRVFTTAYDPINRVTSTTGPLATTTGFGYDDASRTYTVTDAKGQVYRAVRNALGWVETQTDPRGAAERFVYDTVGNLISYTNRRGGVVTTTYDGLSRPLTVSADGLTTTFAYDSLDRWVAVSNSESTDTLDFDAKRRVASAITWRSGVRYMLQPSYTQEGLPNVLKIVAPTWTRDIGYGYDGLFRLNYLRNQGGQAASLAYTAEQLLNTVQLPITVSGSTNLTETFTYNPAHLPQALAYNGGAVDNAVGRRYAYDALGRTATATRGRPAGDPNAEEFQNEVRRTLSYDMLGRLAHYDDRHNWQSDGGIVCPNPRDLTSCFRQAIPHSDLLRQQDFTYDSVGNRRDLGAVIEPGNRLTAFNGYTLAYDADGNLVSKTKPGFTQTLTWSNLGHLVSVTTNGVTTTYAYDGFGRRVWKTVGATTTYFLWDGDDLVMELDGTGNPLREYSYYPGIDRPFAVRRSSDGAMFYYSQELPGHVAGLINTSDQVVNTYEYDPWGQPLSATEGVVQPLQYAGRERDSETGFYYVRARYYDPELGRLISEDPIGLAGGVNPYAYVVDDPVNGRDPFGLCPAGEELIIEVDEGAGTATVSCSGGGDSVTLPVYTLDGVTVTAAAPDPFGGINKLMDDFMARGDQIANAARQYSLSLQGQRYTWSKSGAKGTTDCSHFVCTVLNVPYQTSQEITNSLCFAPIASSQARAGDLMYSPQHHVGIYTGRTDSQGRWEGIDWGQRMPNGPTVSKWGPGGWFELPISFYRSLC